MSCFLVLIVYNVDCHCTRRGVLIKISARTTWCYYWLTGGGVRRGQHTLLSCCREADRPTLFPWDKVHTALVWESVDYKMWPDPNISTELKAPPPLFRVAHPGAFIITRLILSHLIWARFVLTVKRPSQPWLRPIRTKCTLSTSLSSVAATANRVASQRTAVQIKWGQMRRD